MPAKSKPADPAAMVSEDAIRQRAYFLWEADGRPDGRHEHYWSLAHSAATRDFIEATGNGVARGKSANAAPSSVKSARSPKEKLKAKAEPKPARKATTRPRSSVPGIK